MTDEQPPPMTGRGMFLNAGVLYQVARTAWMRMADTPDRAPEQFDALVAVLFAAASLEAFIMELAAMARYTARDPAEHQSVRTFGTLIAEAEDARASLELKFLLTSAVFADGRAYPKSGRLWEDFALLVDARNALVHMKDDTFSLVEGVPGPPAKLIERFRARNILASFPDPIRAAPLPTWLSTRAVGRWACETASDMAQAVLTIMPQSGHEMRLDVMRVLGEAFAPLDRASSTQPRP